MKNKTVVIGMSGGVDSSVAAFLLKKQGYNVIGATIDLFDNDENNLCCSKKEVLDAKTVCDSLNIPHYTINLKKEFKKNVIDYFISEYNNGRTPSPCIMCNQTIKFGSFINFAKTINADFIATGHYADKIFLTEYNSYALKYSADIKKDQTYMLYRLSSYQLANALFPLSSYTKEKVRQIAKDNNIITFNKKDSQGICFVNGDYKNFLKKHANSQVSSGYFIDKKGNKLGIHNGYQFYTIGQRHGLGIKNPHPLFIISIIPETNEIVLGSFEDLKINKVKITNYTFTFLNVENLNNKEVTVRQRFSSNGDKGFLTLENSNLYLNYYIPNTKNAPGQHAVFYDNNILLGGGIIEF